MINYQALSQCKRMLLIDVWLHIKCVNLPIHGDFNERERHSYKIHTNTPLSIVNGLIVESI